MNGIKRRRLLAEMSQKALADRAGIHINTVSRYERGAVQGFNIDVLTRIADVFGCKITDLIGEEKHDKDEGAAIAR